MGGLSLPRCRWGLPLVGCPGPHSWERAGSGSELKQPGSSTSALTHPIGPEVPGWAHASLCPIFTAHLSSRYRDRRQGPEMSLKEHKRPLEEAPTLKGELYNHSSISCPHCASRAVPLFNFLKCTHLSRLKSPFFQERV